MSLAGGIVSSASAVASAAGLAVTGAVSPNVSAMGAVIASGASALVNLPIVARVGGDRRLTRKVAVVLFAAVLLGSAATAMQLLSHRA